MKKLAFILLAAVLLISACKKDDVETVNAFSYDSIHTVVTPYGFVKKITSNIYYVTFATVDTTNGKTFDGKASYVQITMTDVVPGTYTYYSFDSTGYGINNFAYANMLHDVDVVKSEIDWNTGNIVTNAKGGSIKIKKDGANYAITYDILMGSSKLSGSYVGKLTEQ
jgi:hypothetical protein